LILFRGKISENCVKRKNILIKMPSTTKTSHFSMLYGRKNGRQTISKHGFLAGLVALRKSRHAFFTLKNQKAGKLFLFFKRNNLILPL